MVKRKYLLISFLIVLLVGYLGSYFFFKWKCAQVGVVYESDPWSGAGASGLNLSSGSTSSVSNEWLDVRNIYCRDPGYEFPDLTCDVLNTIYFPLQWADAQLNGWAPGFRKFSEW